MTIRTLRCKLCPAAFIIISIVLGLHLTAVAQICNPGSGTCVTTWQQDVGVPDVGTGYVYRTGENLMESTIIATTFNNNAFGQICSTDTVHDLVMVQDDIAGEVAKALQLWIGSGPSGAGR